MSCLSKLIDKVYAVIAYTSKAKITIMKHNVKYFNSDAEFEDFCVALYAVIKKTESGVLYYTGEYSDEYLECIENGTKFVIRDEDSVVYKRQCVCKRVPVMHEGLSLGRDVLVQLSVENLEPYFED